MLQDLNQAHELDHSNNIRTVISKLPYRLRDKWRNKADYLMEDGEVIKFSHVVDFVEVQARIATNPVYGNLSPEREKKFTGKPKKTARSFATSTSTETQQNQKSHEKFCEHCKGKNHDIDSCFKLAKLTTEEILKHLKELGVCFGCLKKGKHHRKDCNKKLTCKKCGRYHPTILHQDKPSNVSQREDKKQGDSQVNSKTPGNDKSEKAEQSICRSTHIGAGDGQGPSPCIVPVKIQCRATGIAVNTLAYLDSGSDAVFCTDQLRQQLGIKGKRTSYK